MSRKRDLSSDISHDERIAELSEHSYLAVALYMMSIPQADDWGRLPGSPREFKMLVCPGFDATKQEIDAALSEIAALGLWERYEVNGKKCIAFPPEVWFRRQVYINISKRTNDSASLYPANQQFREYVATQSAEAKAQSVENGEEQQGTAENGRKRLSPSPSPSLSPSLSPSPSSEGERTRGREESPPLPQERFSGNVLSASGTSASPSKALPAPAEAECRDYFTLKKHPELAEKFWTRYQSVGWRIQGNPITDWQARARQWIAEEPVRSTTQNGTRGSPTRLSTDDQQTILRKQIAELTGKA